MKVEEARQIAKEKIEQLAQELERGQSTTLQAYLAAMAKFPRYSPNNVWLILTQRPDAQQCAGLKTWNRLGRRVVKGEHGIMILAPVVSRRRDRDPTRRTRPDEDTQPKDNATDTTVIGFRGAKIFDISQTAGAPVSSFAVVAGNPGPYTDRLKTFITERGVTIEYSHRIAPARGACIGSAIVLLPDLQPAEHLSTLAHEVAHQLLHRNAEPEPRAKMVRETEAEAVAFVVCQAIGLDSGTASSDYVLLHQGHRELLMASLDRIQRTAAEVISAIGPDV